METKISRVRSIGAWLALAAVLLAPVAAPAHEGHHHQAMGTVKMVHENHLMLAIAEDKVQTFVLDEGTKFVRGNVETTKDDVAAGERAVVTYETEDGADHAIEIRLGEKRS